MEMTDSELNRKMAEAMGWQRTYNSWDAPTRFAWCNEPSHVEGTHTPDCFMYEDKDWQPVTNPTQAMMVLEERFRRDRSLRISIHGSGRADPTWAIESYSHHFNRIAASDNNVALAICLAIEAALKEKQDVS